MKPVKLFMKNIGPYRNEEIDFSALDNMFLITGNTGAGKTFIFDAMTFALYGGLNGNRRGLEKDLKSNFASESDESFVEFTFENAGKKYRVHRTVPFLYTTKTGKTSKKLQEIDFSIFENGTFVPYGEKLEVTNERIKNIIGLDSSEFAKVILLPQGEFSDFLKQNSADRRKTLAKLFPVEFYAEIMQEVHQKSIEEENKLKVLNGQLSTESKAFDFSKADETIAEMTDEIEGLEQKLEILRLKTNELSAKKSDFEKRRQECKKAELNKLQLEKLESQVEIYAENGEKLKLAENAAFLREFISAAKKAESDSKAADERLTESEKKLTDAKNNLEILTSKAAQMALLKSENEKSGNCLSALEDKMKFAGEYKILLVEEKSGKSKIDSLENHKKAISLEKTELMKSLNGKNVDDLLNEVAESKGQAQKELAKFELLCKDAVERDFLNDKKTEYIEKSVGLEKKFLELNELFARTGSTLDELRKKSDENEQKNIFFTISSKLENGCPCPVCGSSEHPFPAKKNENLLDYAQQIITYEKNLENLREYVAAKKSEIDTNNNLIADKNLQLKKYDALEQTCVLQNKLENAQKNYDELEVRQTDLINIQKKLSVLNENLDMAEKEYSDNKISYSSLVAKIAQIEKQLFSSADENIEVLEKRKTLLESELAVSKKAYNDWDISLRAANENLSAAKSTYEFCVEQKNRLCTDFENAGSVLSEKIAASVFSSVNQAEIAMLNNSQIQQLRADCDLFAQNLKTARVLVENDGNMESSDEISFKIRQIDENYSSATEEYNLLKKNVDEKKNTAVIFRTNWEKICRIEEQRKKLENELEPLKLLDCDLNGNNPKKLAFDTWALGMYFEQVVDFASRRFFDISNGRYEFIFKEISENEKGMDRYRGLDLQVLDNFTGDKRDPATLSGGETFEASISLALAITDVVQNKNGGIQLDALFIDEGFGTLDSETLDKAMEILGELQETKMIGIISHVESLKNEIPSWINVNKTNLGSTVTIV